MVSTHLHSAQAFRQSKDLQAAQELVCFFTSTANTEAEHTAESFLLRLGELVLRVALEAGPQHFRHLGMLRQESGDGNCVFLVCLERNPPRQYTVVGISSCPNSSFTYPHTEVKCFQTTVGKPAVEGARDATNGILKELETSEQSLAVRDSDTHDHIRVSSQVFGDRVDDNVSSEFERLLVVRAHERVVHDKDDLGIDRLGNLDGLGDINETQSWVG